MLRPRVLGLGGIVLELEIWHGSNVLESNKLPREKNWYWLSADSKEFDSDFLEIVKFHLGLPTLSPCLAADYNVRDNMRFPSTTVVFYTKGFRNLETIFRKGQRLI